MTVHPYLFIPRRWCGSALIAAAVLVASCVSSDRILSVEDPDIINPADVQSAAGADAVRVGALARLNTATSGDESLFLLGNWHLLWYAAVAMAVVGWREIVGPKIAPLSVMIAAGLLFLFVVFAFTNARVWVTDQTTVNRATLHLAPLLSIWVLIVFEAWLRRLRNAALVPAATSA